MWTRIIIGLVVIIVGFFMVWKTEAFYNFIGTVAWAEAHLSGGTRQFLKLMGVLWILAGFLITFNLYYGILNLLFSPGVR